MLSPQRAEPATIRKTQPPSGRTAVKPCVCRAKVRALIVGGFAVLADGMGGHAGGAVASRMVCENFLSAAADHSGSTSDRLMAGLRAANDAVATKIEESPLLAGMGSTVVGAAFGPGGMQWVSVGDSPLFLFRRGEVAVLNEDHSLAPGTRPSRCGRAAD